MIMISKQKSDYFITCCLEQKLCEPKGRARGLGGGGRSIPQSQKKLAVITWHYSWVTDFGRHDLSSREEFEFRRMNSYEDSKK